jgi:hypothetical protein
MLKYLGSEATFFFFFFVVLQIEPRALHVVGKCSITELHPQPKATILNMETVDLAFPNPATDYP